MAFESCPHCGSPAVLHSEYKIQWEITEGPRRGDIGHGNVVRCDDCGRTIDLLAPMPTIEARED